MKALSQRTRTRCLINSATRAVGRWLQGIGHAGIRAVLGVMLTNHLGTVLATGLAVTRLAAMAVISFVCVLNMHEMLLRTTIEESTDSGYMRRRSVV